jgi:CRP/FNR family cyclic AMP-dependent transcriptional regulator
MRTRQRTSTLEQRTAVIPLFAQCTRKELRWVSQIATEIELHDGVFISRWGRTPPQFIVVLAGHVEVFRGADRVGTLSSGDWFGHRPLLDNHPFADVTAFTRGTCRLLAFSRREFASLLRRCPDIRPCLDDAPVSIEVTTDTAAEDVARTG